MEKKFSSAIHPHLAACLAKLTNQPKYIITATDRKGVKYYFKTNEKGLEYTKDRNAAVCFEKEHAEMYASQLKRAADVSKIKEYTFSCELA